jgi:hypothetical protein
MIKQIAVKIANTNEVEEFKVEFETVHEATNFIISHYNKIYGGIDISKPYVYDDEVVFKIEYWDDDI